MTGVERMLEYTKLPTEPPLASEGGGSAPPGWPRNGSLSYHSVTASYRPSLPSVLRDISFSLPAGTSCGVAGRTGSGKSSLLLTLFRLIDVTSGVIKLDGLDVSSIGLDTLRAQLAIIPQVGCGDSLVVPDCVQLVLFHHGSIVWDAFLENDPNSQKLGLSMINSR